MSPRPFVILLIEDSVQDAHLFSELCQDVSSDIEVQVQSNGQEGLDYLERGHLGETAAPRPQLIVLDLEMPIMDGHMFLEQAKQRDHFQAIPTLVLSVSDERADIQRSSQNFTNGYLVKPDTLAEFKDLIQVIISYWRGTVRLPPLGSF